MEGYHCVHGPLRKEALEDRYLSTQVSALITVVETQKNLVLKEGEKVASKLVSREDEDEHSKDV